MARKIYASLKRALVDAGIPTENHGLVSRMCDAIGIARYEEFSDHVRAIRADGSGDDLHIHWGWTDGFRTEAEVLDATGGVAPYVQSDWRAKGFYYVEHPINRLHEGGGGGKNLQKSYGTCPRCHMALPAVGTCDDCG